MRNRLIVGLVLLAAGCGTPTEPSERAIRVTGRVLGFADGVGVPGVTVAFGGATTVTHAGGAYSVNVPRGYYQPTLDGEYAGTTYITASGYRGDFLIRAGDCVSRYGVVANAMTGRPVTGATVTLLDTSVVTGTDGWYRINLGCPALGCSGFNTSFIYVKHPRYSDNSYSVGRGVCFVRRLDLRLQPA